MPRGWRLLLTCEHGGNRVPREYRASFAGAAEVLSTHRGYDIGALAVARHLSRTLRAPLFASTVTRLLVDLNRSVGHARLFSEFVCDFDEAARARVLDRYYHPHRDRVMDAVRKMHARGDRVVHIAVHSFTPVLAGQVRNAEIGLLYDPAQKRELEFALRWQEAISVAAPDLRVRRNYPYRGTSDGLPTSMRAIFPADGYLGLEVEMNQGLFPAGNAPLKRHLQAALGQVASPKSRSASNLREFS